MTPTLPREDASHGSAPIAELRAITKQYRVTHGAFGRYELVTAVDAISLRVSCGKTLVLLGESGSGKSTVGRLILRLLEPTSGAAFFEGRDLAQLSAAELRRTRRAMQIIFQHPYGSLDPRLSVAETIAAGPSAHGIARGAELDRRVRALLDRVRLPQTMMQRRPAELSGGECQRVAIARALALEPRFIVADEITASLDLSAQAQILNLLDELQREAGLSYLFISHDLDVVRHMADEIAVLSRGQLIESAPAAEFFAGPRHEVSRALLAAVPPPDPRLAFSWGAARGPS